MMRIGALKGTSARDTIIRKEVNSNMLRLAFLCLVIALIAGLLGFTGIAGVAAATAKMLFLVFLVVCVLLFAMAAYLTGGKNT
jgi:uncharacterized membrane protein YtjA (UPF0391 family)